MFEEIAKQSGISYLTGYSVVNYNGGAVYVEGIKRIVYLSNERIVLAAGGKTIELIGIGLTIAALEPGVVLVKGNIKSVSECGDV